MYCHAKKHLIKLFLTLNSIQEQGRHTKDDSIGGRDSDIEMSTGAEPKDRTQSVTELLHITGTEAEQFLEMVDRYQALCLETPSPTASVCGSPRHHNKRHQTSKKRATEKESSKASINQSSCQGDVDVHSFLTCFIVGNSNHQQQQQQQQSASSSSSSSNNFKISLSDKLLGNSEMSLRLGKETLFCFVIMKHYFSD